ncbi:MAG TPA: hypothetical protein VFO36_11045 [Nitrospiraceae bacterium]|nr:hypothetical protein [Nitrospiraceae bacterium]
MAPITPALYASLPTGTSGKTLFVSLHWGILPRQEAQPPDRFIHQAA